jgi:hypothetical protein
VIITRIIQEQTVITIFLATVAIQTKTRHGMKEGREPVTVTGGGRLSVDGSSPTLQGMRVVSKLLACALCLSSNVAWGQQSEPASTKLSPTFFGSPLVEAAQSYSLQMSANGAGVKQWLVNWGDGEKSAADSSKTALKHTYAKCGSYSIQATAKLADGTDVPVLRDYAKTVAIDNPFATGFAANGNASQMMAALLSNASTKSESTVSPKNIHRSLDQVTLELWLRPADLTAEQELVDAKGDNNEKFRFYLQRGMLHLALSGGGVFDQALSPALALNTWHHVAVTYDRAPTFPYGNLARFYMDGILIGERHLDQYDTGAVSLSSISIGRAFDDANALNGSIAGVALYDHWLNPVRILDRARLALSPDAQTVVVVAKNAEDFTVDLPAITKTVDVALNPDPTVDNGPVLRSAIDAAQPGTRLHVINLATKAPGGRFYFNSLAAGQDWTALRFVGKTDFELDGDGAAFIFRTSVRQLTIKQSKRIAFRNFSIDLDQDKYRVGCYARILDVDQASGTVRFQFVHGRDLTPDPKVPHVSLWRWRSYDPKTLRILNGTGMFFQTNEVFRNGMTRDASNPSILVGQTGNAKMLAAFEKYRQGANLLMVNNSDFKNTSVSLWDHCSQVTFDGVNFYATLGMVFLSSEYDHMHITHCRIGLPPGETAADRPLASGADGFHFHENYGYTLFDHNEITLTDDDPISIKDGIWRDVKVVDAQTIQIKDFHVGEEIELYRNDLSPLNYTAKVTAVSGGNITVDKPLPAGLPPIFLAQNHRERSFNWVLRDSYFHDYYGRFLVYTPWARITNNLITRSYLHIGTGAASFDGGGISSHVLVDNNILVDTNADTGLWGIDSSYPVFQYISFVGNAFIGRGLSLNNSGDALVVKNYFENVVSNNNGTTALSVHHSLDLQITGNIQVGIGLTTFGLTTVSTTGLVDGGNTVLAFPSDDTTEKATSAAQVSGGL